ncbi:MAG TPA: hypothetical protein VH416_08835 [Gaiellaceae bacterium]
MARLRLGVSVGVATLVTAIVLGLGVFESATVVAVYVVVVGGLVVLSLTKTPRNASSAEPSLLEEALAAHRSERLRPPELVRVERELVLGMESQGHLYLRLLPLLRAAAAARLAAKHHVDLDRRPEAARALLGDEAWELLRPDRPAPADRQAKGIGRAQLTRIVDVLERI